VGNGILIGSESHNIATFYPSSENPNSEQDVALALAAPDLLAALKEYREYVERCYDYSFPNEGKNRSVMADIDAAIAKAEPE